jgi:hypothetical protein
MYCVSGAPPKSGVASMSSAVSCTTSSTAIHDGTHQSVAAGRCGDLDDDDAAPFTVVLSGELELGAKVRHCDDSAAEIDDTFHMRWHSGYRRDRTEAYNLPNVENGKPIGLIAKGER